MKDEILNYWDMCNRQGMSLQRGMYFRKPPGFGIVLMSRRRNAPYTDSLSPDESVLLYEGHDVRRGSDTPNPKSLDQPWVDERDKPTQNGQFAEWVQDSKQGRAPHAVFRVYEKMRPGVWTDRGLYELKDYDYRPENGRKVFKFRLEQADLDFDDQNGAASTELRATRQIPSHVKQQVYKRDKGRCVLCGAQDQLHFDHDFPFSKGGTSVLPENVRILCARHNLQKSSNIQ